MKKYRYPTESELRAMLKSIGKKRLDKIFSRVAKKNRGGPTIDEYLEYVNKKSPLTS